ncbi:MAG: clostripain-related cysteine peptidase [Chloroflexi bacterium]|nr:clostripain-related cysteine peptidase [Chloroflexota bacterium]
MIDKIGQGQVHSAGSEVKAPSIEKEKKETAQAAPKDAVSISHAARKGKGKAQESCDPKKKWTVLFYFDGNNNLAPMAQHQFTSLQKVGSDENVNLVGQFSVPEQEAERGLITTKAKDAKEFFPGSEKLGVKDMADPATLKDFLSWGMKKYPAENYAVVMWDHGAGFMGSMSDDKSKNIIDNNELAGVLKDIKNSFGKKVDVLDFNACLMGQTEVAYAVKDGADYMVGSEEVEAGLRIPFPGLYGTTPQHRVMNDLKKGIKERGDITPEELSKLYVYESKHQFGSSMFTATQSAIDLKKMDAVKNSADELAGAILDAVKEDPKKIKEFRSVIKDTQRYLTFDMWADPYQDFRDITDFANRLKTDKKITDPAVKKAAENLAKAAKESVISEFHHLKSYGGKDLSGSHGLSAYIPDDYGYDRPNLSSHAIEFSPTHGYEKTGFAKDTKWDEMLKVLSEDKALYTFLKSKGVKDEEINKLDVKISKGKKLAEKVLPFLAGETYEHSINVVRGATTTANIWTPLNMVSGLIRGVKGIGRALRGAGTPDLAASSRAKVIADGAIDTVIGTGLIVSGAALFAGATAIAVPAAAVALGLGVGSFALSAGKSIYNQIQVHRQTVTQKLADVEKHPKTDKTTIA